MLFNSYAFIVLLAVTFGLFYTPGLRRFQTSILIVSSFIFYAYGAPLLLLLLIGSLLFNSTLSYWIAHHQPSRKLVLVVTAILFNLLLIAAFKYGKFILSLFAVQPVKDSLFHAVATLPLPIGISFYTFESISLIVDVYRNKRHDFVVDKSFWKHLEKTVLFVSFFPHLIAGPILKAHEFYPQIHAKHLSEINWEKAFKAIVIGYFLKMVVADNLKDQTYWIAHPFFLNISTIVLLSYLFGYSMQIYADFAGYSLIAIGVAHLFGYRLMDNFNFPYIATSLSEFWQRWHISLSTWLKEYLYFPLGGNRRGRIRTYINLIIVMTLGGLWHGAGMSYLVWGLYHGVGLAAERLFAKERSGSVEPGRPLWRVVLVFSFVTLGWLLFKLPNFDQVVLFLKALGTNWNMPIQLKPIFYTFIYSLPVIFYHAYYLLRAQEWRLSLVVRPLEPAFYGALMVGILLNSGAPGVFIYFQF